MEHLLGYLNRGFRVSKTTGNLREFDALGMAFVEIKSAEDIYDVLAADTAYQGFVGEIEFVDGTVDGLLVAVGDNPLEDMTSSTGLITIIEKDPEYSTRRFVTADVHIDRIFTIRLIQFAGNTRDLVPAIERLLTIFPGAAAANIGAPDQIAGEGQAVVRLPRNPVAHT